MAFIEASLEELPVSAKLGQSCLATKISAPGPSSFGWFRHSLLPSDGEKATFVGASAFGADVMVKAWPEGL